MAYTTISSSKQAWFVIFSCLSVCRSCFFVFFLSSLPFLCSFSLHCFVFEFGSFFLLRQWRLVGSKDLQDWFASMRERQDDVIKHAILRASVSVGAEIRDRVFALADAARRLPHLVAHPLNTLNVTVGKVVRVLKDEPLAASPTGLGRQPANSSFLHQHERFAQEFEALRMPSVVATASAAPSPGLAAPSLSPPRATRHRFSLFAVHPPPSTKVKLSPFSSAHPSSTGRPSLPTSSASMADGDSLSSTLPGLASDLKESEQVRSVFASSLKGQLLPKDESTDPSHVVVDTAQPSNMVASDANRDPSRGAAAIVSAESAESAPPFSHSAFPLPPSSNLQPVYTFVPFSIPRNSRLESLPPLFTISAVFPSDSRYISAHAQAPSSLLSSRHARNTAFSELRFTPPYRTSSSHIHSPRSPRSPHSARSLHSPRRQHMIPASFIQLPGAPSPPLQSPPSSCK